MKKSIMVKLDNDKLEVKVFNEKLVPLKNICACCYVKVRNKSDKYNNIYAVALDIKRTENVTSDKPKPLSDEELEFLFEPMGEYDIWISKAIIGKELSHEFSNTNFVITNDDVKTPEEIAKKKVKKLSTGVELLDKLLENGIKFDELTPTMFGPLSGAELSTYIGFGDTLNKILQGIKNVNGNQQNKSVKSGAEKLFEEVFKKPMYPTEKKVTPDLLEKKVNEIEMMSKIMNTKVKLSKEELFKEDGTRKPVEEVYQTVQDKLKDTVLKSDGKSTKEESDELKKAIQFMESPDPRFEAFKKVNEYFTKLGDAIKSDEVKDSKPMNLEEMLEAINKCESLEELEKLITASVKIPKLKTGEARLDSILGSGIPFTDIMEAIDANFFNMDINNPKEKVTKEESVRLVDAEIDKIIEHFDINFKTFKNEIFKLYALVESKYYVEEDTEESIKETKPPEENFGLDELTLMLCKLFKTEPEKYAKFKESISNIETLTKNINVPNNTNLGTHTHPDFETDYTNIWTQSNEESPSVSETIMDRTIKPCAQGYEGDNNTYLMKIDIGGIINLEALTNYDLEKCDNVKEDIYKFDMKFNSEAKKLVDFCKSFIPKPGKNIFYFTIDFINAITKEAGAIDFKKIKFKKLNRKESKKLCVTFVDANYRVYGSSHEKPFTDLDGNSKIPKSDYDDVFRLVKDKNNINAANMEMFIMGLFNKQTHPHWYLETLVDEFLYTKKFIDFLTKINPSYNMSNCNFELVYKYNN